MLATSLVSVSLLVPLTQIGVDPADLAQSAYLKSTSSAASQSLGTSVGVSGDTVVACAPFEGDGVAHVFVRSGSSWVQEASLSAPFGDPGDFFGIACAIDGDTIVIGALGEDSTNPAAPWDDSGTQIGACYVFERSGTSWSQNAYLKPTIPLTSSLFGSALDLDGDRLLVGAQGANQATLFVRTAGVWAETVTLTPPSPGFHEAFGTSVSLSGAALAVGAPDRFAGAMSAGSAYVFREVSGIWTLDTVLSATTPLEFGHFGRSVSLSGDTLVVGYEGDPSLASGVLPAPVGGSDDRVGAAYVFEYGTSWNLAAYLKAEFPTAQDQFGRVVHVSDDVIAVALAGGSAATGINGNGDDDSAQFSGACYLYQRSASSWSQLAYVKASNTDAGDEFGASLHMDSATFVVGARSEAGGAITIDGNDSDNSAQSAGAAYAFRLRSFAERSFRNAGTNPASLTVGYPTLGTDWPVNVDLTTTGHPLALPFGYVQPTSIPLGGGRTLLAGSGLIGGELFGIAPAVGPQASASVAIPLDTALAGIDLSVQAAHIGAGLPFALSNAYDLVLGY